MTDEEIKRRRKALSDKAAALKELMECGDLSYDEYSQEIAKIQIERRKLKNANVIDVEVVSVEDEASKAGAMEDGPRPLPAVITREPSESTSKIGRDWSNYAEPQRRCRAHKKNGEQCGNASILGSTVCRYHGGASKHVKQAARARIENATDRMAKELLGMAIDPDMAPAVKLSAIKDALDRGGLKAPETVVLSAGQQSGFEEIFDDIASGSRAASRAARGIADNSLFNLADYQGNNPPAPASPAADSVAVQHDSDSNGHNYSGIQFDKTQYTGPASNEAAVGPVPRPSHQAGRDRPSEAKCGPVIEGETAIIAANRANAAIGALRELPPGRSAR